MTLIRRRRPEDHSAPKLVRTIESNLSRIYAKLGIRSRTELAARLRDG